MATILDLVRNTPKERSLSSETEHSLFSSVVDMTELLPRYGTRSDGNTPNLHCEQVRNGTPTSRRATWKPEDESDVRNEKELVFSHQIREAHSHHVRVFCLITSLSELRVLMGQNEQVR